MIKKYSVAWQTSEWLSCEYSRAKILPFTDPATSPGSLDFGPLLHPSSEEREGTDL